MSNFIEKKRRKSFLPCQYYQRFKSYNCKNKDRKKGGGGGGVKILLHIKVVRIKFFM